MHVGWVSCCGVVQHHRLQHWPVSEQLVTTSSLYNVDLHSNKPDQADERGHCAHEARRETLRDSLLQKQGSLLEKQSVSDHTHCQQQLADLLSSFQEERHRRGATNSHNVSKGQVAKKEDLVKAFSTDDQTEICVQVDNDVMIIMPCLIKSWD